jgi:hypothetical protein
MVGIFADQHVRQQSRPRPAALIWTRRQWRLHDLFAAGARHAWPHDPVHDEAAGDVLQLFRHVPAEFAQFAAARSTGGSRRKGDFFPDQVLRQRAALGLLLLALLRKAICDRHIGGAGDLLLFKRQFELVDALRA